MKKIYMSLSLIAFALSNVASAQVASPTITTAAMPAVGSNYYMMSDSTYADIGTMTVSVGGATAQTWNYTSYFTTPNTFKDTTSFVAPGSNPGASSFPSASLASNQGEWIYFSSSSSGVNTIGAYVSAMGVTAALTYTPAVQEFPVPFTYSNTVSSNSTATASATYSGFPINIVSHQIQTITADAFGTVITPSGTYSNTLRYRVKNVSSDSVTSSFLGTLYSSIDSTIEYSWYENTSSALVMRITLSASNDSVRQADYIQGLTTGINSIKNTELLTNLYPNPTSGVSYLTYENKSSSTVSASIFDISGRQVTTLVNNQQQAAGKQILTVDVTNLPQGLYMVQITSNGATKTLKLNVQ